MCLSNPALPVGHQRSEEKWRFGRFRSNLPDIMLVSVSLMGFNTNSESQFDPGKSRDRGDDKFF